MHTKQKVVTPGANTKRFCDIAIYRCSFCDFVPDSTEGMNNHTRTLHNDVMVLCDICKYVTLYKSLLMVHKRARHTFGYVPTNESINLNLY